MVGITLFGLVYEFDTFKARSWSGVLFIHLSRCSIHHIDQYSFDSYSKRTRVVLATRPLFYAYSSELIPEHLCFVRTLRIVLGSALIVDNGGLQAVE